LTVNFGLVLVLLLKYFGLVLMITKTSDVLWLKSNLDSMIGCIVFKIAVLLLSLFNPSIVPSILTPVI
jgi:hypothetical protein